MNKIRYCFFLLGLIIWGPFYKAVIDKLLLLTNNLSIVGQWAQLQNLNDLISAPVATGSALGLTVYTSKYRNSFQPYILFISYVISLTSTFPILALSLIFPGKVSIWLGFDHFHSKQIILASVSGYLSISTILLSSLFIANKEIHKVLLLLITTTAPLLVTIFIGVSLNTTNLISKALYSMILAGLASNLFLMIFYRRMQPNKPERKILKIILLRRLLHYVAPGFSIGILTPISVIAIRSLIAYHQNWYYSGVVTALFRISDSVLNTAFILLYFHFLPIISESSKDINIIRSIKEILAKIFIPSFLTLCLIIFFREEILGFFYSNTITPSLQICSYFWIGDSFRVLASIFLMTLYVLHATKTIAILDFFSQPLLAFILFMGAANSLKNIGISHLAVYFMYSILCLIAFLIHSKKHKFS